MSTLTQFVGGIKRIQRKTITIPNGSTSIAQTILSVDTAKTVLNYLGSRDSNPDATIELTNSTTVTAERSGTTGASDVSYEVIEFY